MKRVIRNPLYLEDAKLTVVPISKNYCFLQSAMRRNEVQFFGARQQADLIKAISNQEEEEEDVDPVPRRASLTGCWPGIPIPIKTPVHEDMTIVGKLLYDFNSTPHYYVCFAYHAKLKIFFGKGCVSALI